MSTKPRGGYTDSELAAASHWTRKLRQDLDPESIRASFIRPTLGTPGFLVGELYRGPDGAYWVRERWSSTHDTHAGASLTRRRIYGPWDEEGPALERWAKLLDSHRSHPSLRVLAAVTVGELPDPPEIER